MEGKAARALEQVLEAGEKESAKVAAAKAVLDYISQTVAYAELEQRLSELEKVVAAKGVGAGEQSRFAAAH